MIASFILAFVAYLPIGYSNSYVITLNGSIVNDLSSIEILWFSIPSSYGLNQTVSYLIPIIGPIALAFVMIGLAMTVRRLSLNENIFGRFGWILLIAGAFSLLLSGALEAFHVPNTVSSYDSYPILAKYLGIALFASGVFATSMHISVARPANKHIVMYTMGLGAFFAVIFAGAVVVEQLFSVYDNSIWAYLNGMEIIGISLVLQESYGSRTDS